MGEKPTQWGYLAAITGLLIGAPWTWSAYQAKPEEFPYEPTALLIPSLIGLLALLFWKKSDNEDTPPSTQHKTKIEDSKNVVADSTNVDIGNKTNIDKQYNIENYVHYGDLKISHLLTNPPFDADYFIGRKKDLEDIETIYQEKNKLLVLINGEGGIGKTTLAAKYWYAHQNRYKRLAWLFAEPSIGTALLGLKDKLGVDFDPNDSLQQQVARITQAINNLDNPCLLIFDNANDPEDLKKYYGILHQLSNCHILLTSRVRKLDNMKVLEVKALGETDAIDLFKHYYPDAVETDIPLLKAILHAVGYNTLVTEVLAKNMAIFNRFAMRYSISDLLQDLQEKGLLAVKNKTIAVVYGSDTLRSAEPKDIIAAMYDLTKLNETEQYLLSNLAVLPAENILYSLLRTLLATDDDTLEDSLNSLEEKGWIEYRKTDNSFKISPVVQDVSRTKNASRLLSDSRTLLNTLTTGLDENNRHTDNYKQAFVFARLAETVILHLPIDVDVSILCQNIGNYHRDTGNLSAMMRVYQKMTDIQLALCKAEPENADFKNGLAISYEKLGDTHSALGNLDNALTFFVERNKLGKELYEAYPNNVSFKNGLAISYEKLGDTHSALGNLDNALTFFVERNKLGKELYEAYPNNVSFKNGLAISYSKLGQTHSALGNLDNALTFFEEDIMLSKELYHAYPNNVSFKNGLAISYEKLGQTHSDLGNLDNALTFFQDETKLFEELYHAYPNNVSFKNGLAISYSKLGETHSALGNLDNALTFFVERNKLGKELYEAYPNNVSFKNGLAISYSKLGETHSALGNLDNALTFFQDETKLFEELYHAYPNNVSFKNGLAISYEKLGDTHSALGNLDNALTFFEEDIMLSKELYHAYPNNVSFKNGLAISYAKLGVFSRDKLKDAPKAKGYFQQAEALWQALVRDAPQFIQFQQFYKQVQSDLEGL